MSTARSSRRGCSAHGSSTCCYGSPDAFAGRGRLIPWLEAGRLPPLTTRVGSYLLDEDLVQNVRHHAWPSGERPFFLYVQPVAPHTPYLEHPLAFLKNQPELVEGNLDVLRQLYAAEIQYTDSQIARLLADLEREGLLDGAYVVITSDHGEEFGEHGGFEHGRGLYGEVVEVPLIIAGPGIEPGIRVSEAVELMDIGPTLLELTGWRDAGSPDLPFPVSFRGRSLARRLTADAPIDDQVVFCETGPNALTPEHLFLSATKGRYRIIRTLTKSGMQISEEAFDLSVDPNERVPLTAASVDESEELAALREALEDYQAHDRVTEVDEAPLEADKEPLHDPRQMDGLGYFDRGQE